MCVRQSFLCRSRNSSSSASILLTKDLIQIASMCSLDLHQSIFSNFLAQIPICDAKVIDRKKRCAIIMVMLTARVFGSMEAIMVDGECDITVLIVPSVMGYAMVISRS